MDEDTRRAAASERMKAYWAAKRAEQQKQTPNKTQQEPEQTAEGEFEQFEQPKPTTSSGITLSDEQYAQLMRRIADLEASQPKPTPVQALQQTATLTQATIGPNGITGIQYKYPVEKGYYPDPTDRLFDLPELKRYAMRENYIFTWEVDGIVYESRNITYSEPKFTVKLFRRIFDEDGNDSGRLALVNTSITHEDELTTRQVADKLGLTQRFDTFDDLMNEVRFLRFRNWLIELFTPVKLHQHKQQARTMVIAGKVVEVFDTESVIDGVGDARI